MRRFTADRASRSDVRLKTRSIATPVTSETKASLLADDPLSCVVLGTGRALEEMKRLKEVLSSMY